MIPLTASGGEYAPKVPIDAVGWVVLVVSLLLVVVWLAALYR